METSVSSFLLDMEQYTDVMSAMFFCAGVVIGSVSAGVLWLVWFLRSA